MRISRITWGLGIIALALLPSSCTSKLKLAQSYPNSSSLEAQQKEELVETLRWEFPKINDKNIEQELQPYVLVKGNSYPLTRFISFDKDLRANFRMHKLDFVPYWKLKDHPNIDILYMEGYGYAGNVWSYVVYDEQTKSIIRIAFFHKDETRTYGGDISLDWYQEQYAGAKLVANGQLNYMSNPKREVYQFGDTKIDGTSGATVTNNGIQAMFNNMLDNYKALLLSADQ
ncbi:MAG: FMN-binding protein [Lewinellaceae bacterium]|nr:FMN-binding protein [Lewinellaceae bacterium]